MKRTNTTVTKKMDFCYGHYLPGYPGDCRRQHGHNAEVEVTLSGINKERIYDGMVCDFKDLKAGMRTVIETLDHRNLNDQADHLRDNCMIDDLGDHWYRGNRLYACLWKYLPPTAENMAQYIFDWLNHDPLFHGHVHRVRVSETPDSWATVEKDPILIIRNQEAYSMNDVLLEKAGRGK
jgi:6-pyruvoyltetrahydropterin/6-carboxytetrahydropterin synthase